MSTPQKALNARVIPYTRGKGLGGSSILNFAVYLYGSAEDYNRWADLVGDESWAWESTKNSFRAIEDFDFEAARITYAHLARPEAEDHGREGTVKVCLPARLEDGVARTMEALAQEGERINLDLNSGDPIGIGVLPSSYSRDGRTTSANAHLVDPPANLTVWTGSAVRRLVFEGSRVVGVKMPDGRKGMLLMVLPGRKDTDECKSTPTKT